VKKSSIALTAVLVAVVLAACSHSPTSVTPANGVHNQIIQGGQSSANREAFLSLSSSAVSQKKSGWIEKDATQGHPLMYVADNNCSCVRIYRQDIGELVGVITAGISVPSGIATDSLGNLWVTNNNAQDVTVYSPGSTSPFKTLTGLNSYPSDIVVADDGTAYVSTFSPTPGVYVYANGATTPTYALFDTRASYGLAVTLDKHGNIYWGFAENRRDHVDEFVRGIGQPIDTGLVLRADAFMTFDGADHLLVSNPNLPGIDVYTLPHTWTRTIAHSGTPYGLALNRFGRLFVGEHFVHEIKVFDYRSGQLLRTIPTGTFYPTCVALYPRPPLTY